MEACVLHTTNGGEDWNQLTIPSQAKYLRALELIDGNKLWAVGRTARSFILPMVVVLGKFKLVMLTQPFLMLILPIHYEVLLLVTG